jgi:hypothetical protein
MYLFQGRLRKRQIRIINIFPINKRFSLRELATIYNRQIINLFNLSFNKRQNIFVVVAAIKLETNLN